MLGGITKTMSLVEFRWRVGLYSEAESKLDATRRGLDRGETVKAEVLTMRFWPSIGDAEFVVGSIVARKIRNQRIRLAHRCIATTISGRRESTIR